MKSVGVGKGDAVVIYLPMLMELPIAMLACARIGAVHSVIFSQFALLVVHKNLVSASSHFMTLKLCSGCVRGLFC